MFKLKKRFNNIRANVLGERYVLEEVKGPDGEYIEEFDHLVGAVKLQAQLSSTPTYISDSEAIEKAARILRLAMKKSFFKSLSSVAEAKANQLTAEF